jgi:GNAT superfamily N-acetyltransferase
VAITVRFLKDPQIEACQDQIVQVYQDAFSVPLYGKQEAEVVDFAQSFPEHTRKTGFRLVTALEDNSERMAGFAYGYLEVPGQGWYESVVKTLPQEMAAAWLVNSFRLVEIAVTPQMQGQGIGGLLHDQLLTGLLCRKAVLSTMQAETAAYQLYSRRGWIVLLDNFLFPGVARPYRIMGLDLERGGF